MHNLLSSIATTPASNVAALTLSLPLPLYLEVSRLEDLLSKPTKMLFGAPWCAPLTPMMNRADIHPPLAESVVLRGVPEWALKTDNPRSPGELAHPTVVLAKCLQAYSCSNRFLYAILPFFFFCLLFFIIFFPIKFLNESSPREKHFTNCANMLYLFCSFHLLSHCSMSAEEGMGVPVSFPRIFSPSLTDDGFIANGGDVRKGALVKSVSSLAHLQVTQQLRPYFGDVVQKLRQEQIALAAKAVGFDEIEYNELINEWQTLYEDYKW